ncbi:MAG TPA: hypothetical protein DD640_06180 [Clostridiales bacterium]|nr:hypothetical protein [Clostridiales bacterium]
MMKNPDKPPINLTEWGQAFDWNDTQRSGMTYFPLHPQINPQAIDDVGMVWLPVWHPESGTWSIGFEWDEPREVAGVELVYADAASLPDPRDVRILYWNSHWPTPMPERWQGARSAWIETEDPRQGQWIWARGDVNAGGLTQAFSFDPLDITEIKDDLRLEWAEEYNVTYRKTLKVRLAIKGNIRPVLSSVKIQGTAHLEEQAAEIRFGCLGAQENWSGSLQITNGSILALEPVAFQAGDILNPDQSWICQTAGTPKGIRVNFQMTVGSRAPGDQTLLTLRSQTRNLTFLAADLASGPIWIKDYGVLASRPLPDADWQKAIGQVQTGRKPIYSRVAEEPEQSYARAAAEIPPLDVTKQAPFGRYTILGWEGVRQKFALRYNGEIFADKHLVKMAGRDAAKVRWAGNSIHFRFGTGDPVDFRQRKDASRQWMLAPQLPVYLTQWEDREIEFTQTAFGALINGPVAGPDGIAGDEDLAALVRLKIRNTTEGRKKIVLSLDITPAEELQLEGDDLVALGRVAPAESVKDGWKVQTYPEPRYRLHFDQKGQGRLKVQPLSEGGIITSAMTIDRNHFTHFGDTPQEPPLTTAIANALTYEIELPGFASHEIDLLIPFTTYSLAGGRKIAGGLSFDRKLEEVAAFWQGFHGRGAQVGLPDPILESFLKAVPWHIMMTANRDPDSGNYLVPAGSYAYDVCGNEACMQIRLLDLLGYHRHAEKYLDTFIRTQGAQMPDGNFTSAEGALVAVNFDAGEMALGVFGYNLDHGCLMSCLADHYFLSGDRDWLRRAAPCLIQACEFVFRERRATMLADEDGSRIHQYGLLPMGHLEDNSEWQYWFAVNGQACGGILRIARALADIGHPEAARLECEGKAYRQDIRAAVQRAMEESPVVQIPDGSYIPHVPTRTAIRGRDWGWFREAGYGPLHLVDGLVLDPNDEKVTWILNDQEDNLFVSRNYGRAVDLEKYWFSRGGVTIQANVLNNGLAYLARGQTAHAIRALYNNIGQHLYPDVMVFSEHPVAELGSGFGPFFKTPDEAQFLVWLRNYLVREDGRNLWICPGAPRQWYAYGQTIKVSGLASAFGELDFYIECVADPAILHASIKMPTRRIPAETYVRLRHPDGRKMRRVLVNGKDYHLFDKEQELVILRDWQDTADIIVQF